MHDCSWLSLFNQMLLPLFIVALLFSFMGVSPEIVIKAATSIAVSLISGCFSLLRALLSALTGAVRKTSVPRRKP